MNGSFSQKQFAYFLKNEPMEKGKYLFSFSL